MYRNLKQSMLFVAGTWDDNGGKPSGYMSKLAEELKFFYDVEYYNGGSFDELEHIIDTQSSRIIFWFADVPNDKPKLVSGLKSKRADTILITSKRNDDEKYSFMELISRALSNKANLMLVISKWGDQFLGTVIDPLGNKFADKVHSISNLAGKLACRINELLNYTRIPSVKLNGDFGRPDCPDQDVFFREVQTLGNVFHDLIHPSNTERFLGNCSFRCSYGFPSFRSKDDIAFVSQRNIDKRGIRKENFVPILLTPTDDVFHGTEPLYYFGGHKPSVDAPIQRLLYQYFPNIDYMVHAHVSVEGASTTDSIIPCGAIEEFFEIVKIVPKYAVEFKINLMGHGCLIGSVDCGQGTFTNIPFIPRKVDALSFVNLVSDKTLFQQDVDSNK